MLPEKTHLLPPLWDSLDGTRFVGVDQSITGTGLAFLNGRALTTSLVVPPKTKPAMHPVDRLAWFHEFFLGLFRGLRPGTLVVFEGYAFGMNNRAHSLGELGGAIRLAVRTAGHEALVVPPSTLKKFVTGKGNAKKDVMVKEVFRRFGVDVDDDNEADAAALAIFGTAYRKMMNPNALPKAHLESLNAAELLPTFRPPTVPSRPRARPL